MAAQCPLMFAEISVAVSANQAVLRPLHLSPTLSEKAKSLSRKLPNIQKRWYTQNWVLCHGRRSLPFRILRSPGLIDENRVKRLSREPTDCNWNIPQYFKVVSANVMVTWQKSSVPWGRLPSPFNNKLRDFLTLTTTTVRRYYLNVRRTFEVRRTFVLPDEQHFPMLNKVTGLQPTDI